MDQFISREELNEKLASLESHRFLIDSSVVLVKGDLF
jgi:hypothetical protein